MKSFLFVLFASLFFHKPSYALDSIELADAWVKSRFTDCDPILVDIINTKNVIALNSARKGDCANLNLKNLTDLTALNCFKILNHNLQVGIEKSSLKVSDYGCKENPKFTEFLASDKKALKVSETVIDSSLSCEPGDNKKNFTWGLVDGKTLCTRKFNCRNKFNFGKEPLDPGTYYLRCNDQAKSQKECDDMNLSACVGKEVSYAKVKTAFGVTLYVSDSTPVKASKAPAAQ